MISVTALRVDLVGDCNLGATEGEVAIVGRVELP